ncbi:MAG: GAF domain-containing protein [Raineya sp.]|jgi:methyl-accepting chemotaxis protein|nr:GAF domain-containing protein [Raineya sp.]
MSFRVQFILLVIILFILVGGDIVYIGIYNEINILFKLSLLVLTIADIGILVYVIDKHAFGSFKQIERVSKSVSDGELFEIPENPIVEIQPIYHYLGDISSDLEEATKFIKNIGSRKFDFKFNTLSTNEGLGKALVEMSEQLQKISHEEQSRNWTVTGIAKFSDLLRDNQNLEINELAYIFIRELTNYIDANQGAVYIIDRDVQPATVEAVAAYAYARRKFLKKSFYINEGLVGRCILDDDVIYMDDIPQNYIHITSGLGEALPKSVLLAPIRVNEVTYGVVEVASFNLLEPYQIEFVKNISEDFASNVANAQINIKTKDLLSRSQAISEELAKKEQLLQQTEQVIKQLEQRIQNKDLEIVSLKNALSAE